MQDNYFTLIKNKKTMSFSLKLHNYLKTRQQTDIKTIYTKFKR